MLPKLSIYSKKRHFAAPLTENKTFFEKKLRGFVVGNSWAKVGFTKLNRTTSKVH